MRKPSTFNLYELYDQKFEIKTIIIKIWIKDISYMKAMENFKVSTRKKPSRYIIHFKH